MELKFARISTVGERIVSFIIDHILLTMVFMTIVMSTMMNIDDPSSIQGMFLIMPLFLVVYFMKDFVNGRSIGKRIFKIGVRNSENPEEVPNRTKLFIRNLTIVIWPIEFLVLAFNPNGQRLGDKLAGTIVVKLSDSEVDTQVIEDYFKTNETLESKNRKNKKRILLIILSIFIVITLFFSSIIVTFKNSAAYKTAIQKIEKDKEVEMAIGNIEAYGFMPMGSISISNGSGEANFRIKVNGENGECFVLVILKKEFKAEWEVIEMKVFN